MNTVEVSENFYSLEGEAEESGSPTVYTRFARCNKKCPMWNNPDTELSQTGYAALGFNPTDYKHLSELPTITKGCDSQYAVNPVFSHLWQTYTAEQLLEDVLNCIPFKSWVHPLTNCPVIYSLTGGEPTIRLKWIVEELIPHPLFKGCKHILFETNASAPMRETNIKELYRLSKELDFKVTWSNSPKTSNSGELWNKSIIPKIPLMQLTDAPLNAKQYFKFVIGSEKDLNEIETVMNEYYKNGISKETKVYLMPEACTTEQQNNIARDIANLCMEQGYIFSIRLQNILWGNLVGT